MLRGRCQDLAVCGSVNCQSTSLEVIGTRMIISQLSCYKNLPLDITTSPYDARCVLKLQILEALDCV